MGGQTEKVTHRGGYPTEKLKILDSLKLWGYLHFVDQNKNPAKYLKLSF